MATTEHEGQDAHTRVLRRHGGAQRGAPGEPASPSHVVLGTQGVMASASATVSTEASGGSRLLVAEAAARAAATAAASLQDEMNLESGLPVAHAGQMQASEARQIAREVLHAVLGGSEATGSWRGYIEEEGARDPVYGIVSDHEVGSDGADSYDEASVDLDIDLDQELDDCDELGYPKSPFDHDAATLSGTVSSLDLQVGGRAYLNVPQALPLVGPAVVIAEPYRVAALPAGPGPASRCLFARRAQDIRASLELAEVHQAACTSSDRALSRNAGSLEGASPVPEGVPPGGCEDGGLRSLPQGLGGERATASGKAPAKKPPSRQAGAAAAPAAGPVAAAPRKAKRRPTSFRRGEQLGGGLKAGVSLESHHALSEKRAAGAAGARPRPRVLSRGRLGQDNVLRGRAIGTGAP